MRTGHDPEADASCVRFASDGITIEGTDGGAPGAMIDFEADVDAVGLEVLNVGPHGRKAEPVAAEQASSAGGGAIRADPARAASGCSRFHSGLAVRRCRSTARKRSRTSRNTSPGSAP